MSRISSNTVITLSTETVYDHASGVAVGRQSTVRATSRFTPGRYEMASRNWHRSPSGIGSLQSVISHAAF